MPQERSAFMSYGIGEPLTNRIKGILDEYPDGTQIARELLQNSDDARSTVQWYLLDHHDYNEQAPETANGTGSSKLRLFHADLQEYMGPALLAGSDSIFEDRDFESLRSLAASKKRMDESKIGQMGIGFNRYTFHFPPHCFTVIEGAVGGASNLSFSFSFWSIASTI